MQLGENRDHTGDTMVASTQLQDKLGDKRSQNDKMSTNLWRKGSGKVRNREKKEDWEEN